MTDVELDARVTALEENGGGGAQNRNLLNSDILRFLYEMFRDTHPYTFIKLKIYVLFVF